MNSSKGLILQGFWINFVALQKQMINCLTESLSRVTGERYGNHKK
jgi:hypothetical protein